MRGIFLSFAEIRVLPTCIIGQSELCLRTIRTTITPKTEHLLALSFNKSILCGIFVQKSLYSSECGDD